jgi:hypothetical protein
VFFTFSTTQEYYSMPCYPALALLLGCAMGGGGIWIRRGTVLLSILSGCAAISALTILFLVRGFAAPGDIAGALSEHPEAYTLSLGHVEDLTLRSFAYLRLPLAVAAIAFLIGAVNAIRGSNRRAFLIAGLMMVLFFHAARLALIVFDPYLSSRPLAEALLRSPAGELIVDHHYYTFSSIFFYTDRKALLLNGRFNNLVYGSYAPEAPSIFINDADFSRLWQEAKRYYIVAELPGVQRIKPLAGPAGLNVVAVSGGKFLLTNHPLLTTKLLR